MGVLHVIWKVGHPKRYRPRVAAQTVRCRLRKSGVRARRPFKGPILTQRHRRQRLEWARGHLPWTRQQWQEVQFSEESHFNLSHADESGLRLVVYIVQLSL
jgi:hypothetical protein